jgi:hypothetical protein
MQSIFEICFCDNAKICKNTILDFYFNEEQNKGFFKNATSNFLIFNYRWILDDPIGS